MKFKISVPDFQYAMRTVKDVVPTKGILADTAGVWIRAQGDLATFSAFNQEVVVEATVKIERHTDGVRVVDAAALYSAISHFKPQKDNGVGTTDILVSCSDKAKKLTISAKTRYASGTETAHKRVFALKSQDFFPTLPDISSADTTLELPASILMEGIDCVSYALSSDANQLIFTGVLLEIEDDILSLFATDGVCLAQYKFPIKFSGDPVRVILPGSFTSKVAKSFFDTDSISVSLTSNMIFARTPNLVIGGALIRDDFPNYKEVLPDPETFICLDKHMLLDNLVNMSYEAPFIDDARVTLTFSGGDTTIKCGQSTNNGIPNDYKGEISFDCNLGLLSNSIRNIFGNELKVGIKSPTSPITFLPAEHSHNKSVFTCLLVPLSL